MKNNFKYLSAVVAAVILGSAVTSEALPLVDFKAVPTSPNLPEFALTPTQFVSSTGAISANSADPFNPTNVGGLLIETPLTIAGAIPGKQINISTGSTQFFDTSLTLVSSIMPGAGQIGIPGFGNVLIQPVSAGSFEIRASASPAASGVLLLSGTFSTGGIGGVQGSTTSSFQANAVTYTGGAIYDELVAVLGGVPTPGDLSVSMNDITSPLSLTGPSGSQQLVPFGANATGLFSVPVIPEPMSASWLGGSALALLARRRRA